MAGASRARSRPSPRRGPLPYERRRSPLRDAALARGGKVTFEVKRSGRARRRVLGVEHQSFLPLGVAAAGAILGGVAVFAKLIAVKLAEEEREAEAETVLGVFFALQAAGAHPVVTSDFTAAGDEWTITYEEGHARTDR
jgi:hypothetical protein